MLWWPWTLLPFECGGGVLARQCSNEFLLWLLKPDLSPVRKEASGTALARLQLLQGCYTNMAVSRCVRKFTLTRAKQGCMEEWFSKERSKEHLERSDKAGMPLSQSQRDKTAHHYCFSLSVIYVVAVALTFTLLKLLSGWSALWLFSWIKELSRSS